MLMPSSGSMSSRNASRMSASVVAPRALLERDRARKQHVVLEVDVAMQVALELRQFRHAHAIGRTSVGRRAARRAGMITVIRATASGCDARKTRNPLASDGDVSAAVAG